MCFNEPDIVTVHSAMNIMTANGVKVGQRIPQKCLKLLLSGAC